MRSLPSWLRVGGCGTGSCWRFWPRRECVSARRWAFVTAIFCPRRREVTIVPRDDNANGARTKTMASVTVPVSAALVRLYSDYMHREYGELDSDYVFVNLWAHPRGHPLQSVARQHHGELLGRILPSCGRVHDESPSSQTYFTNF